MTAPQFTPTPGPWYQVGECRTVHADKSDGRISYSERVARIDSCPEAVANARLIAAAPELYEALLCTSGSIDHSLNCRARYGGECCCGKRALTNQINTALAKARGEEVTA